MTIPNNLLELCLTEFKTYEKAIRHPLAQGSCKIGWIEPWVNDHMAFLLGTDLPREYIDSMKKRFIEVRELPSGSYTWLPNHPDDLETVVRLKNTTDSTKTKVLAIKKAILVSRKKLNQELVDYVKTQCKKQMGEELFNALDQRKNYKISIHATEGFSQDPEVLGLRYVMCYSVCYSEVEPQSI